MTSTMMTHSCINNQGQENEGYNRRIESSRTVYAASPGAEGEFALRKGRPRKFPDSTLSGTTKSRSYQIKRKSLPQETETCHTVQALLLAVSVLVLSFYDLRHGRTVYSLLENGSAVTGFVSSHRAVITLNRGYSAPYSLVSSVAACMLLYSLITRKARWSLPTLVLSMADFVCDFGDAVVATWLFFSYLKFPVALTYVTCAATVVAAELWVWMGVLRLYERRTFE
ncbi:uncharacterized protein LOC107265581 [Cephus cinctus]|uniref:Uncharacterized protein LOC107265581 n=1 Tax=Cephus cinctus TaxID=211228 RepID=A0AAJ7BNU5_CEPCN|nr:uncharacterized protein LOC107265581 [Cephus cinctus]